MISLQDKKWKPFKIIDILGHSENSHAYHKKDLLLSQDGIPYITRKCKDNGLSGIVQNNNNFVVNPPNTISFGAENAAYYFQPFKYITGNKMYYYCNSNLPIEVLKFLTLCLNHSLSGGFGFGFGLTGTRSDHRQFLLPVDNNDKPDYQFMVDYIKEKETILKSQYKKFIKKTVNIEFKNSNKKWKDFSITELFVPNKGNQNNMSTLTDGNIPLVSAKKFNNGYKAFVSQNNKKVYQGHIITLNIDGDGGAGIAYYQPYKHLLDSHVTALIPKNKKLSKYTLLFIATAITKQRDKYGHGYSIKSDRLNIFRFMLPVNEKGEPDYKFMEDYMKYLEQKKLLEYLDYIK